MQTINPPAQVPRLEPPGAGIPWYQLLFVRYYVGPFVAGRADVQKSRRDFETVHAKILQLVKEIPDDQLNVPVLVPPQTGLEDSSRYWSAAMTLEHLLIVGQKVRMGIKMLMNGKLPPEKADIATLKPLGQNDPHEVIRQFKEFTRTLMPELEPLVRERDSDLKFSHPWFGPFRARQWFWLFAVHAGIHYRQLKAIRRGLARARL